MAPRTRIVKLGAFYIASLAVWPFGSAQFSAFWDGISLQDDGTEEKTCPWLHISQLERCICKEREGIFNLGE